MDVKYVIFTRAWGAYNAGEGPCRFRSAEADRLVNARIARLAPAPAPQQESTPVVAGGVEQASPEASAEVVESTPAQAPDGAAGDGQGEAEEGGDDPILDYHDPSLTLDQIRTLAKARGIRSWHLMNEDTLRTALQESGE